MSGLHEVDSCRQTADVDALVFVGCRADNHCSCSRHHCHARRLFQSKDSERLCRRIRIYAERNALDCRHRRLSDTDAIAQRRAVRRSHIGCADILSCYRLLRSGVHLHCIDTILGECDRHRYRRAFACLDCHVRNLHFNIFSTLLTVERSLDSPLEISCRSVGHRHVERLLLAFRQIFRIWQLRLGCCYFGYVGIFRRQNRDYLSLRIRVEQTALAVGSGVAHRQFISALQRIEAVGHIEIIFIVRRHRHIGKRAEAHLLACLDRLCIDAHIDIAVHLVDRISCCPVPQPHFRTPIIRSALFGIQVLGAVENRIIHRRLHINLKLLGVRIFTAVVVLYPDFICPARQHKTFFIRCFYAERLLLQKVGIISVKRIYAATGFVDSPCLRVGKCKTKRSLYAGKTMRIVLYGYRKIKRSLAYEFCRRLYGKNFSRLHGILFKHRSRACPFAAI